MRDSAKEHEDKMIAEAMQQSKEEEEKRKKESPPPAAAAGSEPPAASAAPANDNFSEDDIKTLMGYGFTRDQCVEELRAKNGNVRDATAALFARSLKF